MIKGGYQAELEELRSKVDKNHSKINEILKNYQHNMFVEDKECQKYYQHTFDAVKDEYFAFEKVDLIDYWNGENERRN